MHIPDGFIDAPTSAAAGVVAIAGIGLALRGSRRELSETAAPMAGLVAVFIFAGQMINFPVGAGTSGHLIGAALAAILVGPYTAVLAMSVVLGVQALVFADGGLSALGLNITNLAIVAVVVAWLAFRAVLKVFPYGRTTVLAASFVAGLVSTVAAALAFSLEFAIGGTEALSAGTVTAAMVSVHVVIGAIEGLITALVVGAVLATRSDLVFGIQDRIPAPVAELTPTEVGN